MILPCDRGQHAYRSCHGSPLTQESKHNNQPPSLSLGGGRSLKGLFTSNVHDRVEPEMGTILGTGQFAASANARMLEGCDSPLQNSH